MAYSNCRPGAGTRRRKQAKADCRVENFLESELGLGSDRAAQILTTHNLLEVSATPAPIATLPEDEAVEEVPITSAPIAHEDTPLEISDSPEEMAAEEPSFSSLIAPRPKARPSTRQSQLDRSRSLPRNSSVRRIAVPPQPRRPIFVEVPCGLS